MYPRLVASKLDVSLTKTTSGAKAHASTSYLRPPGAAPALPPLLVSPSASATVGSTRPRNCASVSLFLSLLGVFKRKGMPPFVNVAVAVVDTQVELDRQERVVQVDFMYSHKFHSKSRSSLVPQTNTFCWDGHDVMTSSAHLRSLPYARNAFVFLPNFVPPSE